MARPTPRPRSARSWPDASRSGSRAISGSASRRGRRSWWAALTNASGFSRGWYVAPTVFAGVRNEMRIAREEVFGPVLSLIAYRGEAEAVRIANDSEYGLGGAVWTEAIEHGMHIARQVRTGSYGVNTIYLARCGVRSR